MHTQRWWEVRTLKLGSCAWQGQDPAWDRAVGGPISTLASVQENTGCSNKNSRAASTLLTERRLHLQTLSPVPCAPNYSWAPRLLQTPTPVLTIEHTEDERGKVEGLKSRLRSWQVKLPEGNCLGSELAPWNKA